MVRMERVGCQLDLRGVVDGGVLQKDGVRLVCGAQAGVGAREPGKFGGLVAFDEIHLLLNSFESQGDHAIIGQEDELAEGAVKVGAEALDFAGGWIELVEAALYVAIFAFERAGGGLHAEVEIAAVCGPDEAGFDGLVVGKLVDFAAI